MNVLSVKLFIFLLLSSIVQANKLLLPQEQEIFGFATEKGKQVVLAEEKNQHYLVYRFGKSDKVELEFPANKTQSWKQFKYTWYLRPQQEPAEGMDNNYVTFVNGSFEYTLYETYVYTDSIKDNQIGIKVKNLKTGVVSDIPGVKSTQRGTLIDLRDNNLIKKED